MPGNGCKKKSKQSYTSPQKRTRLQDDPLNLAKRPSIGKPEGKKKSE